MLTELCQELRNWFDRDMPKYSGKVSVSDNAILIDGIAPSLTEGQCYRLIGTLFNDGVHTYLDSSDTLVNEPAIDAVIWAMRVPPAVLSLAEDIASWQSKYGTADSINMSPYNSESFGGYSYSKSGGGASSGGSSASGDWRSAFASRLNRWRKI